MRNGVFSFRFKPRLWRDHGHGNATEQKEDQAWAASAAKSATLCGTTQPATSVI
jgi:hypothetical protein